VSEQEVEQTHGEQTRGEQTRGEQTRGEQTQGEQTQGEQAHGKGGSDAAEPTVRAETTAPVMASASAASAVESPAISPDREALPKDEADRIGADRIGADKTGADKIHTLKFGADKAAVEKAQESLLSGRLLIMSPGVRSWQNEAAEPKVEAEPIAEAPAKRRITGMAAIVALATLAGAVSGAFATIGVTRFIMTADAAASTGGNEALEASVSRIDADIVALKAGLELAARTNQGQYNKTNDRIEKMEKAQTEPSSKLAKLSEVVDKLRAVQAAVPAAGPAPAAAKDVKETTGSIAQSSNQAAASSTPPVASPPPAASAPKTEIARLPKVEGWVLRDVNHGSALIEGRQGLYEVYAGDPVPGLGRVDAIRKQDGHWVVVTSKGLVVAR
jgi:hypothetical protein